MAHEAKDETMKFNSEQGILAEALGALARIASSRNAGTPALAGVKLSLAGDTLTASSTDQDIALEFTLSVGGDTDGQGLISARMLNDIVRVMPGGKVTVEVAGDNATSTPLRQQVLTRFGVGLNAGADAMLIGEDEALF